MIKKVLFKSDDGFGRGTEGSTYLVNIDHDNHRIEFEQFSGGAPNFSALVNFVLTDDDVRKELKWALHNGNPDGMIGVKTVESMSGSKDILVYRCKINHRWALPYKSSNDNSENLVYKLHISCYDKLNAGINDIDSETLLELVNAYLGQEAVNDLEFSSSKKYADTEYMYRDLRLNTDMNLYVPVSGSLFEEEEA